MTKWEFLKYASLYIIAFVLFVYLTNKYSIQDLQSLLRAIGDVARGLVPKI